MLAVLAGKDGEVMATIAEKSKGGGVTYYIDEASGTVVAKLHCSKYDAIEAFARICENEFYSHFSDCPFEINDRRYNSTYSKKHLIKDYYIGKAKCSADDKFDPEFGKKLALNRAKAKYHDAVSMKLFDISRYIERIYSAISVRSDKDYDFMMDAMTQSEKCLMEAYGGGTK